MFIKKPLLHKNKCILQLLASTYLDMIIKYTY